MPKSISRFEWILGGFLAVALVLVVGFLFFYWNRSRSDVVPVKTSLTAQEAYDHVEPAALNWANDAQLVNARTTWNRDSEGEFGRLDWSFIFYSPGQQATGLFAVNVNSVNLLRARPVATAITPSDITLWQVDSPAVVDDFFAAIQDIDPVFMETIGEATFVMTLNLTEIQPVWTASLTGMANEQYFWFKLDAQSGATLDIVQIP